jgi:hypothetical protein
MFYKAPDNSLHFIEPAFSHMLPTGSVPITDDEAESIRMANTPTQTIEQIKQLFIDSIQTRLDNFAQERGYSGILSACTYATSLVTKFKNEGKTCVNLRDSTWAAAYDILAQVEAGTRPMPSSIADIEADLPALVWAS